MTTPSRRLALDVFDVVLTERRFLDDALQRHAEAFGALAPRDRGFVRTLLLTAFRRLGQIDAEIDARLERPLPETARRVRQILRLGVAELRFLEVPPHAAVDAAVTATKGESPRLAGLVNAVLRRIVRETPGAPPDAAETSALNTPHWMRDRLVGDWGDATAAAIIAAQLEPAPLDLTPKSPRAVDRLTEALAAELTPTGSLRLAPRGDPAGLPGYAEGDWWVQDAAAALPVRLLDVAPGARVLDLCAAPGGKTLQLAAGGAEVTALDISEWRLRRVDENLERTQLAALSVHADALTWRPEAPFEAVVLDAPCSATGTIRRHPEALRIKTDAGLPNLVALQDKLLDAAWDMTAPGGRLVFCTCSIFKAEGEERAAAFLERHPEAAVRAVDPNDPALGPFAAADGGLRTLPSHWSDRGGLDGFYAIRFDNTAG